MKSNWPTKKLGELEDEGVIELGRGQIISKNDIMSNSGNYPIYSSSKQHNAEFGHYGSYIFDEELITWSVDGGGNFFYRPRHKFSVTNVSGWLRILKPEVLNYKFLFFSLYMFHQKLDFDYVHKAHPSVIRKIYIIPLPPLETQKKIVTRIGEFFAKIDKAKELRQKALAETEQIFPSALKDIFERHEKKEWQSDKVKNLFESIQTGTTPPSKEEEYFNGDIQWFTPVDLGDSKFLYTSSRTITHKAIKEGKAKLFQCGTLLFVGIGATLGKVGIASREVSANQQITGLYFKKIILSEYAYYWFLYRFDYIRSITPYATLPILNQNGLKNLRMDFSSLSEQKRIVDYLDGLREKVEKLKKLQQEQLNDLAELKKSILDKAFKGELVKN
jgi:type I restriction enzyme, S subunit